MKRIILSLVFAMLLFPLFAYISGDDEGNFLVNVNGRTIVMQKDTKTVFLLPDIVEKTQGQTLRVPTVEELKNVFADLKGQNYDSSKVNSFSLSFSLGFFEGFYGYDYCFLFATKDGKLGTVRVSSSSMKLYEDSFVVAEDPYNRCPPTILWRVIE